MATFRAGVGYTSVLDVAAGTGTTSTNPTVELITTADGDAIFGVACSGLNTWGGTSGLPSGTLIDNEDVGTWGGGTQYFLQPVAGSYLVRWFATTEDWSVVAVAFKETLKQSASISPSASI